MSLGDPVSGRELAAFVAAVESGTIQGSADALALTQSAATKRVQALERRFGQPLLTRTAAGVRPTELGSLLYPLAREALDALGRAESVLEAPQALPLLRIQASRTVGELLLPEWLGRFRATTSAHRVSADITNTEHVLHAVRDGEAEIGFVEGLADDMHGLREILLAEDELRAVVAVDHPWARRHSIPARALVEEPFLAREPGSGTRAVATRRLAAAGVHLTPALEVSSAEGLKRAVLGGGFALLSARTVAAELDTGTLAVVPVSGVDMTRTFRAVRRSRPALQGPARSFWRWLEQTRAAGR
ncbi:MAG TPA: LysR family transcriptional regulator [Solirubrobacteraceae bacterium]|jgi:DNA-binding transcriptional LysR family regulator|nr:LysR family transcriptional regulator [Solirubrobacteraceae bacterium]